MKRLYVLLGVVLVALSVIALAVNGAMAGGKRYAAASFNRPAVQGFSGSGFTLSEAKSDAKRTCEAFVSDASDPAIRKSCKGAVWVNNGWVAVAYEKTLEGPPFKPQWGWGWGYDKHTAKKYALKYCRKEAKESCRLDDIVPNKGYPEGTAYRSPTFDSTKDARGGGW